MPRASRSSNRSGSSASARRARRCEQPVTAVLPAVGDNIVRLVTVLGNLPERVVDLAIATFGAGGARPGGPHRCDRHRSARGGDHEPELRCRSPTVRRRSSSSSPDSTSRCSSSTSCRCPRSTAGTSSCALIDGVRRVFAKILRRPAAEADRRRRRSSRSRSRCRRCSVLLTVSADRRRHHQARSASSDRSDIADRPGPGRKLDSVPAVNLGLPESAPSAGPASQDPPDPRRQGRGRQRPPGERAVDDDDADHEHQRDPPADRGADGDGMRHRARRRAAPG